MYVYKDTKAVHKGVSRLKFKCHQHLHSQAILLQREEVSLSTRNMGRQYNATKTQP